MYDAVVAAGMRPIVEISFTPPALASNAAQIQAQLWYNGVSPNISKPIDRRPSAGALPTWDHWQKFMADIVRHLEERYGADEVRNNWYFEVWNEATWMYAAGAAGYNELYRNTALGLMQRRSGGQGRRPRRQRRQLAQRDPGADRLRARRAQARRASSSTSSPTTTTAQDSGANSDAGGFVNFKRTLMTLIANKNFTGEFINDEWGPGYDPELSRDTEASASFIAKSVHFIGTDTTTRVPTMYGYWTLSDIYEEMNTGSALAYREGNYGLLLKGDPNIPASFDLAEAGVQRVPPAAHDDRHGRPGDGRHRRRDRKRRRRRRHAGRRRQLHPGAGLQPPQQLRHRHLADDGQRVDAGVADHQRPAVHADARPALRRRPHALELAHGVGRHGQAGDAGGGTVGDAA